MRNRRPLVVLLMAAACGGAAPVPIVPQGQGTGRFAVAGPLVLDKRTGLTWQRNVQDAASSWSTAKAACEGLTVDGRTFRLPTLEELKTLVDERLAGPTLDPEAFPGTRGGWYFTDTPVDGSSRFVWVVDFASGGVYRGARTRPGLFRCIQVAPPQAPAPYDEPLAPDKAARNAQVLEVSRSSDRIALKLAFKAGPAEPFAPGQSVRVGVAAETPRSRFARDEAVRPAPGALLRRRYTVVSTPRDLSTLELLVKLVPDGQVSPRLHALNPGDSLWVSPTYDGRALAEVLGTRNAVFVAQGAGVAEFLSFLRALGASDACEGKRKVALLHGAARSDGLWYREELLTLQRACKAFTYVPSLLKPELETPMWSGQKGALDELWAHKALKAVWGTDPTPRDTHVRICADAPDVAEGVARAILRDGFVEGVGGRPGNLSFCEVD